MHDLNRVSVQFLFLSAFSPHTPFVLDQTNGYQPLGSMFLAHSFIYCTESIFSKHLNTHLRLYIPLIQYCTVFKTASNGLKEYNKKIYLNITNLAFYPYLQSHCLSNRLSLSFLFFKSFCGTFLSTFNNRDEYSQTAVKDTTHFSFQFQLKGWWGSVGLYRMFIVLQGNILYNLKSSYIS